MAGPRRELQPDTVKPGGVRAIVSPEVLAALLVGALAVVLIASQVVASPGTAPSAAPTASVGPSSSAAPSTATGSPSPGSGMSPLVRSSLEALLTVDQRLAGRVDELRQAIGERKPVAEDIATILRNINTDLATGTQAANQLQTAPQTAGLGGDLVAFYESVVARNAATLGTSIRVVDAYVAGGARVIKILDGLKPLDARIRVVLRDAGVQASPSVPGAPSVGPGG
jgi:hypothetical protein